MDRREFLKTTGAAAAAATAATTAAADAATQPAPAVAKDLKELRLAMPWPDSVSGPADQARRLAQRITAMSGGRYRFSFIPGVGSGLAAVRAGEADLYYASEHDHLDAHRALAYFAGLPADRGIAPRHLAAWMLVGGGEALWDELAGDLGVKAMLAGHAGAPACLLATRRIGAMGELAGEKVSVAGLAREVARGVGLEPVASGAAEAARALARGEILAAEHGGAITSHALGLTAAASCSAGTSINRHGSALSLGLRRSLWDGLGAADQAIFSAAAATGFQLALAEEEAHRRLLSPQLSQETWPLARELDRALARVADAVVAHVAAGDAQARRINAGYEAFRRAALGEEPASA